MAPLANKKKNTSSELAGRAWRLLRLALLWTRKGGALKRNILIVLRLHAAKALRRSSGGHVAYFEREMSFDETPVFHFKLHRPTSMRMLIPCINPQTSLDVDDQYYYDRKTYFCSSSPFLEGEQMDLEDEDDQEEEESVNEVDVKAEEFIERFYEQMKLQRQISLLQYNEMIEKDQPFDHDLIL